MLPSLLERTLERGWRAVVQSGSAERLEALDLALWTYNDESFLPHGTARDGDPARQPIYLTLDDETQNGAGVREVDAAGLLVDPGLVRAPAPRIMSDDDVERAIEGALLFDPRVIASDVVVAVSGGVATLAGTVGTVLARTAAELDAASTAGVRRVENDLRVVPKARFSDATASRRIRRALETHPQIGPDDVREIYWDPAAVSGYNGQPGAYVGVNGSQRYRRDELPSGPFPR